MCRRLMSGFGAVALGLCVLEAQQAPTFRTATDVVAVDVMVVATRDGAPLLDLQPADFVVTVDGKPRRLQSVDLVRFASAAPVPGAVGPTTPPPAGVAQRVVPVRRFVLAIDAGNISRGGARAALAAASAFIDRLPPADLVAVVTLPAGAAVDFTTDRQRIRDALGTIVGGGADWYTMRRGVSLAESFAFVTGRERRLWTEAVQDECRRARSEAECMATLEAEARQLVMASRAAAQVSSQAFARLIARLGGLEGPKHVVLISESLVTGTSFGTTDGLTDLAPLAALAQTSRVNLYVLHLDLAFLRTLNVEARSPSRTPLDDASLLNDGLTELAGQTGAAYFKLMTAADPVFDRIARETSASYVIAFETTDADRDGKAHRIDVRVGRPGADVRARKVFTAGRPSATSRPTPSPAPTTAPPATPSARPAGMPATPPRAPETPAKAAPPASPEAEALAVKVSEYLTGYLGALSAVVCEERYEQQIDTDKVVAVGDSAPRVLTDTVNRELVSDFLVVRLTGAKQWLAFRDVYQVNGQAVHDREDRLVKLFLEPTGDLFQQVERIKSDSSRFNIGAAVRDTNVPTFALQFLLPEVRGRFAFKTKGSERLDGVDARILVYQEVARPTLITGEKGEDVPSSGQFWVDPADGAVLKTRLDTRSRQKTGRIDVTFRRDAKLALVVPAEMVERHKAGRETVSGRASYTNFRRFTVNTTEVIR